MAPDAGALPPALVLVTGPPGAGKSTLAPRLADRLGVPCISRDAIHDLVFDGWVPTHPMLLEVDDAAASSEPEGRPHLEEGRLNWDLFLYVLGQVAPHTAVVGETPLNHAVNRERLLALRQELGVPFVEVFLHGDPAVLMDRVVRRAADPTAHAIKVHFTVEGARRLHASPYPPLLAPDDALALRVDTTDIAGVDIDAVAEDVRGRLTGARLR
jgi:hypothetical protein